MQEQLGGEAQCQAAGACSTRLRGSDLASPPCYPCEGLGGCLLGKAQLWPCSRWAGGVRLVRCLQLPGRDQGPGSWKQR